MKKLIRLMDKDIVLSLNNLRRAQQKQNVRERFSSSMHALYGPRITWLKLVVPLLILAIPIALLRAPLAHYWLIGYLAINTVFFGIYFWRLALIRQRFLDKHQVDEFGATNASPDDLYELPSD